MDTPVQLAQDALTAGIEAARPGAVFAERVTLRNEHLRLTPVEQSPITVSLGDYDRIIVVGAGNAAGQMAAALDSLLGDRIDAGVVVTDQPAGCSSITERIGDHPLPSARNREATAAIQSLLSDATAGDLVIGLFSGGGSALLSAPAGDLGVDDLQQVTDRLLTAGASIDELNTVRKHCSTVKGGQLALTAAPATTIGLAISDVTSNEPAVIASGPFTGDPTTYEDALDVLETYALDLPAISTHLRAGAAGQYSDSPETVPASVSVIATNETALRAAYQHAERAGIEPMLLSSRVRGSAQAAGRIHGAIAAEIRQSGQPVSPPAMLLSGGETTVTVDTAGGTGGPNQEFALAAAHELTSLLASPENIAVGAVDTDGIDGPTDAAGAVIDPTTLTPEAAETALTQHNVTPLLAGSDHLLQPGPTGTNVNDLRVIVVTPKEQPAPS